MPEQIKQYTPHPTQQTYWTLSATIIWIYLRDIKFLEENWKTLQDDKSFPACLAEAITLRGQREPDWPKKLNKKARKRELYEEAPDYEPSIECLTEALCSEQIQAIGVNNGKTSEIPAVDWAHMDIKYIAPPVHAAFKDLKWFSIKIKREQIVKLWPELNEERTITSHTHNEYEPDYKSIWDSNCEEDIAWALLSIAPETAKRAEKNINYGSGDNHYCSRINDYASRIGHIDLTNLFRKHQILMNLDWSKGKKGVIKCLYARRLTAIEGISLPDKLRAHLISIGEMPHDDNLEKYKDYSLYTVDPKKQDIDSIHQETDALAIILGLEPNYFSNFWTIYRKISNYKESSAEDNVQPELSSKEQWLHHEYSRFLKHQLNRGNQGIVLFGFLEVALTDIHDRAEWKGCLNEYVQDLYNAGVLFTHDTLERLKNNSIIPEYKSDGWAVSFYKEWINSHAVWDLEMAAKLYLGDHPGQKKSFIWLGNPKTTTAGGGIELKSKMDSIDSEIKRLYEIILYDKDGEHLQARSLSEFMADQIDSGKIEPVNKEKITFKHKDIVSFFQKEFTLTLAPSALFIALGIEKCRTKKSYANNSTLINHNEYNDAHITGNKIKPPTRKKTRETPYKEDIKKAISTLKKDGQSLSAKSILDETITNNPDVYSNILKCDTDSRGDQIVWIKHASQQKDTVKLSTFNSAVSKIKNAH